MIVYNNKSDLTNVYLGNTNIAKVYVGTHQVYPNSIPPTPVFEGKYKLTLSDSSIVSGDCTLNTVVGEYDIKAYSATTVEAEIGTCATEIGGQAFMRFTNLEKVTIPNTITIININAFNSCSGLTSIDLPDSVTILSDNTFTGCKSLSSATLSNNITNIGNSVFKECRSLSGITIPDAVTEIGSDAFKECRSLSSITIPDAVTKIGSEAFKNCTGLTAVTIGSGITEIGSGAFQYSDNITSLTIYATTPPTIRRNTFTFTGSYPIYCPCESLSLYQQEWAEYASRITCIPTPSYQWVSYASGDTVPTATTVYGVRIYPLYDSSYNVTFSGSNGDYIRLYPDGFSDWSAVDENGTPIDISSYRIRPGYTEYEIPFSDLGMGGMNIISPTTVFKDDIDLYVTN